MRHFAPLLLAMLALGCDSSAGGNRAPALEILSPAQGSLYEGGQVLSFMGRAVDPEDGLLPTTSVTWWVELHHSTHTHPFVAITPGNSGTATVPTVGETSSDVFLRFHFQAIDSDGNMAEVTRDVLPHTAVITLSTVPAGLTLALDGRPTAEGPVTAVVGLERSLGAATQDFGGRRYAFASWSDGLAATHTISAPSSDTTYTATFTDVGPANVPPSVTVVATGPFTAGVAANVTANVGDTDGSVVSVTFYDGANVVGTTDVAAPFGVSWTPTTSGSHDLTARAVDDAGGATTSAIVTVTVAPGTGDTAPPTCSITSPTNFAANLSGTVNVTATATDDVGVVGVQFELDGEALGAEDTSAPYAASVASTDAFTTGQHVIRAIARDAAGHVVTCATSVVSFGGAVDVPSGFTRQEGWVTGLSSATAMSFAPDGRLFVCQQGGALRVIGPSGLAGLPFVSLTVDSNGERGLLGVAFDPAFASNQFVYVYYTVPGSPPHNRVSRFTANGDVAVAGSELILMDLPNLTSATNHNGGAMHFGPDGKLYVAVGENASSLNAQDDTNVLGKMLRLNTNGSIPTDNPFYAQNSGQARAIWAKGLRNPFTFAFQPGTGRMHINDVGQNTWEEVNLGVAGANYGWPTTEGRFNASTYPLFTAPRLVYGRPGNPVATTGTFLNGYAIIGAAFYDPGTVTFPASYVGDYFFGDYVNEWVARMDLDHDENAYTFARFTHFFVDLATGPDGNLYVLGRSQVSRVTRP